MAAHGGCGATTVVEHLPAARESTLTSLLAWATDSSLTSSFVGVQVCVVAAATPDGTGQGGASLQRLHAAGYPAAALHLALVSDGHGPVPVSVRARTRLLRPAVTGMHLLPHVQRWRFEDRSSRTPSRKYARAVERLWAAVSGDPLGVLRAGSVARDRVVRPHPSSVAAPSTPSFPAYAVARTLGDGFREGGARW